MTAEPGAGFEGFFAREIAPWIEEKETERKAVLRRSLWRALPVIAFGLACFVASGELIADEDTRGFGLFASIAVMIGGALLLTSVLTWGREFAEELSAKVFGHFGYEYAAEPPDGFLRPFEACRLLPGHDRQSLEDHVRGEVGGVPFELAEAFLERKVRRDKRDDYDLVFRGLVARYRFPKRFSGRTYVLGDRGILNAFSHAGGGSECVRLEDPRFEERFEVFSDDQVEARYLLTPAFMERLVRLADMSDGPMQAAFAGDELLLVIDGRRGYFAQPSPWRDLRCNDHIHDFVEDIAFIREIAEVLKLDAETRV